MQSISNIKNYFPPVDIKDIASTYEIVKFRDIFYIYRIISIKEYEQYYTENKYKILVKKTKSFDKAEKYIYSLWKIVKQLK